MQRVLYKVSHEGNWFALVALSMLCCLGVLQCGIAQECKVTIKEDLYFQPSTEVAGEKIYPEIIVMENKEIIVWSVPNRGRLVFNLIRKKTSNNQLVANQTPLPVRFRGLYMFEFGGIYSTFPWHKRDNQPLLLEWELLKDGACGLRMWSTDPETDISLIAELFVPPIGSEIRLVLRLVNPRPLDQTIDFGLVMIARPGGAVSEDTELLIPVEYVTVGESEGQWMGEKGRTAPWPAPWNKWGYFSGAGAFYFGVDSMRISAIAVYNPKTDETICLKWKPQAPWTTCEVFSWGPAYTRVMGAYDGFRIELKAERLTILKESDKTLEIYISTEGGRPSYGFFEH